MSEAKFNDTNELEKIAISLFYGWGYNFYSLTNQLRADDIVIRNKTNWLLGLIRDTIKKAENDYRKENILPASRENPFPDPNVIKKAKNLEDLNREISKVMTHIANLPVPENDKMSQRHRNEKETLATLLMFDRNLVGQTKLIHMVIENSDIDGILENMKFIKEGLMAIRSTMIDRQAILM